VKVNIRYVHDHQRLQWAGLSARDFGHARNCHPHVNHRLKGRVVVEDQIKLLWQSRDRERGREGGEGVTKLTWCGVYTIWGTSLNFRDVEIRQKVP
jgi:hypothetical protein